MYVSVANPGFRKKVAWGGRKYEKGAHGCDIVQQLSILTVSPHHPMCTLFMRRVQYWVGWGGGENIMMVMNKLIMTIMIVML